VLNSIHHFITQTEINTFTSLPTQLYTLPDHFYVTVRVTVNIAECSINHEFDKYSLTIHAFLVKACV